MTKEKNTTSCLVSGNGEWGMGKSLLSSSGGEFFSSGWPSASCLLPPALFLERSFKQKIVLQKE